MKAAPIITIIASLLCIAGCNKEEASKAAEKVAEAAGKMGDKASQGMEIVKAKIETEKATEAVKGALPK